MKEFIDKEKCRLQALFEPFDKGGSWLSLFEPGRDAVRLGIVDSYTVTRVAPHFDAKGEIKRIDFWLLFKAVGYDEGFQHAHTIKVVKWSQEDTYLLDLVDDRTRNSLRQTPARDSYWTRSQPAEIGCHQAAQGDCGKKQLFDPAISDPRLLWL